MCAGGVAWATIPGADNTIHGCYRTAGGDNQGQLRVVEDSADCRSNETAIEWNQKGPTGSHRRHGAHWAAGTEEGDKGDTGATGAKGDKGDTGATGAKGDTGATGPAGQDGTNGTNGQNGAQGLKGDPGAPGTNGTNGAPGQPGPPGPQGPQGPQGPSGTGSTAVYSVGPTDRTGVDVQPNNAQSPSPIGSLTLPVGTYLVLANVTFVNSASFFAQDNSRQIRCGFGWLGGLGNPTTDMNVPGGGSSAMAVQTIVTQDHCRPHLAELSFQTGDNVDSHVNATNFIITAVKLGSVN